MRRPARRWGLASLLLAAAVVVVLVGAATAWLVARAIGPGIFQDHLATDATAPPAVVRHAEVAFATASGVSTGVALLAALAGSVAVTVVLTRRIGRSLAEMRAAAGKVAAGDYSARVPEVPMGAELEDLAGAFNRMARDLQHVEVTRTRMLGDLAHEMRTPVATLGAYLEGMQDGVMQADGATVSMLREQVARLARLGEDIALVTSAEEGRLTMRREPVPLQRILDMAVAQAGARYAAKGVALHADVSAGTVTVQVDLDRMGQVLTNLLDNALRHTPAAGTVRLGARRADGVVRVWVADDGEGIAPEHLPRVFDRFYRADTARDRAHGGSGVGLAVARSIAHAHGGTVTAASDGPGTGAVFTVELPVAPHPLPMRT